MTKTLTSRFSKSRTGSRSPFESWHGGGDTEIYFYARSLQNAAHTLVGNLNVDQKARNDWDTCPVVLLYRQALEIHLKMLVGEGSTFLPSPTDPISLSGTHSLRWLARIVGQVIRAVGWESDFICEGVSSLADFRALVTEVELFDPVSRAIRLSRIKGPDSVSQYFRTFSVVQFAEKLDGLLNLLDVTADALAATWDERPKEAAAGAAFKGLDHFKTTIH